MTRHMSWVALVVSVLIILLAAELFTNGVEWVGEGFGSFLRRTDGRPAADEAAENGRLALRNDLALEALAIHRLIFGDRPHALRLAAQPSLRQRPASLSALATRRLHAFSAAPWRQTVSFLVSGRAQKPIEMM